MLMLYRQALNVRKPNESDHVVLCMEGKQGQWVTVSPLGNYFFLAMQETTISNKPCGDVGWKSVDEESLCGLLGLVLCVRPSPSTMAGRTTGVSLPWEELQSTRVRTQQSGRGLALH